ncbi:hypothetical protein Pelo_10628 [Pelomyxa schiedti]|nr:hypothetical protein Pelo_10628 [Pelomyxa schiedti]
MTDSPSLSDEVPLSYEKNALGASVPTDINDDDIVISSEDESLSGRGVFGRAARGDARTSGAGRPAAGSCTKPLSRASSSSSGSRSASKGSGSSSGRSSESYASGSEGSKGDYAKTGPRNAAQKTAHDNKESASSVSQAPQRDIANGTVSSQPSTIDRPSKTILSTSMPIPLQPPQSEPKALSSSMREPNPDDLEYFNPFDIEPTSEDFELGKSRYGDSSESEFVESPLPSPHLQQNTPLTPIPKVINPPEQVPLTQPVANPPNNFKEVPRETTQPKESQTPKQEPTPQQSLKDTPVNESPKKDVAPKQSATTIPKATPIETTNSPEKTNGLVKVSTGSRRSSTDSQHSSCKTKPTAPPPFNHVKCDTTHAEKFQTTREAAITSKPSILSMEDEDTPLTPQRSCRSSTSLSSNLSSLGIPEGMPEGMMRRSASFERADSRTFQQTRHIAATFLKPDSPRVDPAPTLSQRLQLQREESILKRKRLRILEARQMWSLRDIAALSKTASISRESLANQAWSEQDFINKVTNMRLEENLFTNNSELLPILRDTLSHKFLPLPHPSVPTCLKDSTPGYLGGKSKSSGYGTDKYIPRSKQDIDDKLQSVRLKHEAIEKGQIRQWHHKSAIPTSSPTLPLSHSQPHIFTLEKPVTNSLGQKERSRSYDPTSMHSLLQDAQPSHTKKEGHRHFAEPLRNKSDLENPTENYRFRSDLGGAAQSPLPKSKTTGGAEIQSGKSRHSERGREKESSTVEQRKPQTAIKQKGDTPSTHATPRLPPADKARSPTRPPTSPSKSSTTPAPIKPAKEPLPSRLPSPINPPPSQGKPSRAGSQQHTTSRHSTPVTSKVNTSSQVTKPSPVEPTHPSSKPKITPKTPTSPVSAPSPSKNSNSTTATPSPVSITKEATPQAPVSPQSTSSQGASPNPPASNPTPKIPTINQPSVPQVTKPVQTPSAKPNQTSEAPSATPQLPATSIPATPQAPPQPQPQIPPVLQKTEPQDTTPPKTEAAKSPTQKSVPPESSGSDEIEHPGKPAPATTTATTSETSGTPPKPTPTTPTTNATSVPATTIAPVAKTTKRASSSSSDDESGSESSASNSSSYSPASSSYSGSSQGKWDGFIPEVWVIPPTPTQSDASEGSSETERKFPLLVENNWKKPPNWAPVRHSSSSYSDDEPASPVTTQGAQQTPKGSSSDSGKPTAPAATPQAAPKVVSKPPPSAPTNTTPQSTRNNQSDSDDDESDEVHNNTAGNNRGGSYQPQGPQPKKEPPPQAKPANTARKDRGSSSGSSSASDSRHRPSSGGGHTSAKLFNARQGGGSRSGSASVSGSESGSVSESGSEYEKEYPTKKQYPAPKGVVSAPAKPIQHYHGEDDTDNSSFDILGNTPTGGEMPGDNVDSGPVDGEIIASDDSQAVSGSIEDLSGELGGASQDLIL